MTSYTERHSLFLFLIFILLFCFMQTTVHFVFDLHKRKGLCKAQVSGQCYHLICAVTLHSGSKIFSIEESG